MQGEPVYCECTLPWLPHCGAEGTAQAKALRPPCCRDGHETSEAGSERGRGAQEEGQLYTVTGRGGGTRERKGWEEQGPQRRVRSALRGGFHWSCVLPFAATQKGCVVSRETLKFKITVCGQFAGHLGARVSKMGQG